MVTLTLLVLVYLKQMDIFLAHNLQVHTHREPKIFPNTVHCEYIDSHLSKSGSMFSNYLKHLDANHGASKNMDIL